MSVSENLITLRVKYAEERGRAAQNPPFDPLFA
jgi:hypothetical protein